MCKILIAQKETTERKTLRSLLERNLGEAYQILEAKTGREVVRLCEKEQPRILLLDIELPGISGLEAARQLRAQGESCVLIFMSAYDNFAYAREAISLRAQNYLLKPCTEAEIMGALEEAIRLYGLAPNTGHPELARQEEAEATRLLYIRERIETCIRNNYHDNISLQKVAQAMNYSDTHFCRLFKRCFGENFSAYLTAFRIERAKEQLHTTMDTVKEVGIACGYTDTSYFIRVFKRLTGMTPNQYRVTKEEHSKKVP